MDNEKRKKIIKDWIKVFKDDNEERGYFKELRKKSIDELKKERERYFWHDTCFGNILDEIFIKYNKIIISKIDKIIKEKPE